MAKPAFIRHSAAREAAIQRRLLDVLESQFRRKIAATIRKESEHLVDGYQDLGYVPAATDDDFRAFRDLYMEIGLSSARAFGSRIVSQGKAAGLILETKISFTDLFRSLAMAWVNQEAIRRRITYVTENTRDQIVREVARGQADGLGVQAIARDINKRIPKISRTRGALIARTETHGAANHAMHEAAKSTGLELIKEWSAVEDARTRRFGDGAEYNHLTMDGQRREMDEPFDMPWINGPDLKIMFPGQAGLPGAATINCLPPWSRVRLAGIKRVMRCEYVGDLFEFSFAGPVNFTVTANHPVLTQSGWKAARHVVEGDKLLYCGLGDHIPVGANADIKNGHSRVDQLYNALKPLSDVVRADLNTVNFHGDMPNGDVDIVSAHGKLRNAMIAEGRNLFGEITLADTHISKGLLLASRMFGLSSLRSADHPYGGMCGLGSGNSGIRRGHSGLPAVSFANAGTHNAQLVKASVNHASGHAKAFGDAVGAVAAIEHGLNIAPDTIADNTPSLAGSAFKVCEVTSIKSFHYRGPVYNCETDNGLIVSDGIVNHNCRCAVIHVVKRD